VSHLSDQEARQKKASRRPYPWPAARGRSGEASIGPRCTRTGRGSRHPGAWPPSRCGHRGSRCRTDRSRPRTEHELQRVVAAGRHVAADVIGVMRLRLRHRPHVPGQDPLAVPASVALDLGLDLCGRVTGVSRRNARRSARDARRRRSVTDWRGTVGRRARTAPRASARHGAASRRQRSLAAGRRHARCRATPGRLIGPWTAALDRELELERPGAVAVARQRPRDPARPVLARGDEHELRAYCSGGEPTGGGFPVSA
jgi:hypothetical protein